MINKKGFTLIELLVVISIIALLSSVVLASLQGARAKGRDAKRLSDMRQLSVALELYKNQNGSYPSSSSNCGGNWCGGCQNPQGIKTGLQSLVSQGHISSIPQDPTNAPECFTYEYISQPSVANSGWSCTFNGETITAGNIGYMMRFATERPLNGLPTFVINPRGGYEYCILSPR